MSRTQKPETVGSLREVARCFQISETTLFLAKRTHADFPTKHTDGYHVQEFESFANHHAIWHRGESNGNGHGMTLAKARMDQILQSTGRLRIANQRAQLELDILTSKLAWRSDVESFHRQLGGVILRELKNLDDIVGELPKRPPTKKHWQALRGRLVEFNVKAGKAVAESAREFVATYQAPSSKDKG